MSKKISIIIPMYNASLRIKECLNSVVNQTYDNLEIIVINDGSTDNSRDIVEEYMKNDSRIKLINQANGGVSKARNNGLSCATGDYIEFVDSDDTLEKEMVQTLVELLEKNDCQLAMCNNTHPFFRTFLPDKVFDFTEKEDFLEFYQQIYAPLFPWNKLWKKECLEGLKFQEDIKFSEDELFCCGAYANVSKAVTTSKRLYNYYMAKKDEDDGMIMKMVKSGVINSDATFYFMGYKCLPYRIKYFKEAVENHKLPFDDYNDIAYVRVFDYVFMEWFAYTAFNIPERMLYRELYKIYNTAEFQQSLKLHEKYGFKFFKTFDPEFNVRLVIANALMINSMREDFKNNMIANPTQVAIAAFLFAMTKPESNPIESKNICNMLYQELNENSTPLAHIVNKTIDRLQLKKLLSNYEFDKELRFEELSEVFA